MPSLMPIRVAVLGCLPYSADQSAKVEVFLEQLSTGYQKYQLIEMESTARQCPIGIGLSVWKAGGSTVLPTNLQFRELICKTM